MSESKNGETKIQAIMSGLLGAVSDIAEEKRYARLRRKFGCC